jgi:hypothetical protein
MGSDCDDVGALALLHTFADKGQAEILAWVYSSGKVPYRAGVIDAINHYYNRPEIPVGADWEPDFGDSVDKMGAEQLASDTARFGHRIVHNQQAEEQVALARSILAAQPDHSVTYVTIGHTKALYQLLQSQPDSLAAIGPGSCGPKGSRLG